jgi:hypothetical protein
MKKLLTVALVGATTLLAVQTATAGASTTAKGWKYKSFQATSCWLGGRPFS